MFSVDGVIVRRLVSRAHLFPGSVSRYKIQLVWFGAWTLVLCRVGLHHTLCREFSLIIKNNAAIIYKLHTDNESRSDNTALFFGISPCRLGMFVRARLLSIPTSLCLYTHLYFFFRFRSVCLSLFFSFFFVFLRSLFFSLNVFFTFPLSIFLFFIVLSCELSCFHFIDSNYSLAYSIFFPSLLSLFSSVVLSLHLSISLSWCLYPLFSFLFLSFLSFFLSFSRILQTILPL